MLFLLFFSRNYCRRASLCNGEFSRGYNFCDSLVRSAPLSPLFFSRFLSPRVLASLVQSYCTSSSRTGCSTPRCYPCTCLWICVSGAHRRRIVSDSSRFRLVRRCCFYCLTRVRWHPRRLFFSSTETASVDLASCFFCVPGTPFFSCLLSTFFPLVSLCFFRPLLFVALVLCSSCGAESSCVGSRNFTAP